MTTATREEPSLTSPAGRNPATPKVSVIIPSFNVPPELLYPSLDSISTQTFSDFECLVIDESTDAALARCCREACARDERFRYIHPDDRLGLAGSLNLCISMARGELIARFDSDDICMPNRLKLQVDFLDSNPAIDIVGGGLEIIDNSDRTLAFHGAIPNRMTSARRLHITTPIAHPAVMMRKSVIARVGGYDPSFRFAEDLELWLRLLARGARFANLKEPLVKYRQPDATRKPTHWKSNLMARLHNFSFRFFPYRIIGIVTIALWVLLPTCMQSRIVHWLILTRRQQNV